jgi:hypothetical protein
MFTHIFEKRNFDIDSLPWKQTQHQLRKKWGGKKEVKLKIV